MLADTKIMQAGSIVKYEGGVSSCLESILCDQHYVMLVAYAEENVKL